jgi:opacity protein-like surface antigen
MKRVIISLALGTTLMCAGGSKNMDKPASNMLDIPVVTPTMGMKDFYIGLGVGTFKMDVDPTVAGFSKQELTSNTATLFAGYEINDYLDVQLRYTRGIEDIEVDTGVTTTSNSTYSNIAVLAKIKYKIEAFTPYALVGYGENEITNAQGSDRQEAGFQYGIGASYSINNTWEVFVDYMRTYDGKGFNRLASKDDIDVGLTTFGIHYRF